MNDAHLGFSASLRWSIYGILIAIAIGNMSGRLFSVNAVNRADLEKHLIRQDLAKAEAKLKGQGLSEEDYQHQLGLKREGILRNRELQRPFLSANDRSRWLGVRALVELGTYEIDDLLDRHNWNTIDMVQHRGRDGELHLYSSKPPLLITIIAGEYWVLNKLTGFTLDSHPYLLGRLMLLTINILPLGVMFWLIAKLAEQLGTTDWGRIFVVAAATMGTFLNTFAVVLNNHTVAAVSATVALYAFVQIWCGHRNATKYYVLAGLAATFTAANELPALSFLALFALGLFLCDRKSWLVGFLPAMLLVVVAFFATNYAAHDCWTPPYMHRSEENPEENWYDYTYTLEGQERESYWRNRQGIDRGEASQAKYALHVLVGHHGVFSLTPIWLLSMYGILIWLRDDSSKVRWLAVGVGALTIICLVFYIFLRPQVDRNYGGMCSGFRWMFWFAPLWLVALLPTGDKLSKSHTGRLLAYVLLGLSTLSASYPTWNPWTQPWIYRALEYCGWQGF